MSNISSLITHLITPPPRPIDPDPPLVLGPLAFQTPSPETSPESSVASDDSLGYEDAASVADPEVSFDAYWAARHAQALTIATTILEVRERNRSAHSTRDGFWAAIAKAWDTLRSDAYTHLVTGIRDGTLDFAALPLFVEVVTLDMHYMLDILAAYLSSCTAEDISRWNDIAHGMYYRLDIAPVRAALAPTSSEDEWSLTRAWIIAAGLDVYLAVAACPGMFTALRGVSCRDIIHLAPMLSMHIYGQPLELFTECGHSNLGHRAQPHIRGPPNPRATAKRSTHAVHGPFRNIATRRAVFGRV
ncbi:hypothetical protein CC85DRAFT_291328 [Cutaneotrichosporon oleaginosum]|uniref:Uncharacterized protein n=1 Tax=Cutaneotrichosporon oleaginosum TaxID=879819 RepID=A0A0J0XRE4_9TREE|nr:uncharacterized protein CC85DRAFT_291328 [Cutaneotrichosporon oleaginosum]KLT43706.1 hypothetical protein CC85DRAFT_291328 [Cutaneotrichosporon oleaginosum]TXT05124.1 hypothetical protein COLE_06444 [Cutaneotrichosporon oleaginosum]